MCFRIVLITDKIKKLTISYNQIINKKILPDILKKKSFIILPISMYRTEIKHQWKTNKNNIY